MCAIFGICGENNKDLLKKISDSQKFRGPDSQNFFYDRDNLVNLGSNRLAVVDAEGGNQPMHDENNNFVIVFNGCIYNFKSIKKYLEGKNIRFTSDSDTEVLLKSYIFFGQKCFNYFDGMWACAIYDKREKKLVLSRDYLGQKPLYYSNNKNKFIFSSQISGILEDKKINLTLDKQGLAKYFYHGFFPADISPYNEIKQVRPGEILTLDLKNFQTFKKIYWEVTDGPDYNEFFKKNDNDFKKVFSEVISNYSIADKKIALSLSGGIDSFLVAHFFVNAKGRGNSFSLGFEEKSFDETRVINKIDLNLTKKVFQKKNDDLRNVFIEIAKKNTEIVGDSSLVPTYILFSHIKNFSNVALTGDGGDENFFGYVLFDGFKIFLILKKFIPKFFFKFINRLLNFVKISEKYMSPSKKIKTFFKGGVFKTSEVISNWICPLELNEIEENLKIKIDKKLFFEEITTLFNKNSDHLRFAQKYMIKYYLPTILIKVDQASMLNSVESRSPFLSKAIINYCLNTRTNNLYKLFQKKLFLKNIFKFIPKYILKAKKHGFAFQKEKIMRDKDFINKMIRKDYLLNKEFFEKKYSNFLDNKGNYSNYIWHEITLNNFLQKNKR